MDLGESDKAVVSYREAVRLTPSYEHALNNLGNLEKARGDPQQAALLLQRATEVKMLYPPLIKLLRQVSPKFAAAHMNLGIVLQKLGQVSHQPSIFTPHHSSAPDGGSRAPLPRRPLPPLALP